MMQVRAAGKPDHLSAATKVIGCVDIAYPARLQIAGRAIFAQGGDGGPKRNGKIVEKSGTVAWRIEGATLRFTCIDNI